MDDFRHIPTSTAGSLPDLQATFIATVQHEFRTPLALILGYAELLNDGEIGSLPPAQRKAVACITNHAQELRTMMERINTLMNANAHGSVRMPLDLNHLVVEVVEERRETVAQLGLHVELSLAPDREMVVGDPYQLRDAVACLVENAVKFTPAGGRIEVRVYREANWVCVAVKDTGIGIPIEEQSRIFAPFYQSDASDRRSYGGLGLGLAVVQAVVREHNGQIDLDSRPGEGSRFEIRLPRPSESSVLVPGTPGRRRRILVVDDEPPVAITLQAILKRLPNCEVAVATDGRQALQLFEASPFDLLITDYKMPGIDGMALASQIRHLYPQVMIVFVTAYASDELRERAHQAAVYRVLAKPVDGEEVRRAALEAFSGQLAAGIW